MRCRVGILWYVVSTGLGDTSAGFATMADEDAPSPPGRDLANSIEPFRERTEGGA
jgi:hypothetical protein